MRISDRNCLVRLQSENRVPDGLGGFTTTWATRYSDIWASIQPASGSETTRYRRAEGDIMVKITMPYNAVVKVGWRVLFGDIIFSIRTAVNVDMRNETSVLFCSQSE